MSESTESTQPLKIKKPARWPRILLSALGVLALLGVSVFGGYQLALGDRKSAASEVVNKQLTEQFQYALVDIQFGRYEPAKQRLEYIIANDPNYPGAAQKLTELLVLLTVPTATVTPLPTPTPNPTGAEGIFTQAQALVNAKDWAGQLSILGTAGGSAFASYTLEVLVGEVWTPLAPGALPVTTPTSGVLGLWDTTTLPNGPYILRLIVSGSGGELAVDTVAVVIGN